MPSPSNKQNALKWVEMAKKESDLNRAKHYFDMALEFDPENIKALNGKGITCYRLGEYDEAIDCYDRITDKGIKNPAPVYFNKSMALRALHKNEASLNFINKTLRYEPSNERALNLKNELEKIMRKKEKEHSRQVAMGNARDKIAVTTYTKWDPPAPATLLNRGKPNNWNDYKYQKGFGEDLIKETAIAEKIDRRIYCCGVCYYRSNNDVCKHKKMAIKVSPKAICKHFKPVKGL